MLLLSLGFVLSGRFVIMDGLLTLFTTVCLLAMFLAVRGPRVRPGWWLVAAVACSLGVLTKGPVAIVLTVPPLVALRWLDRTQARVRLGHWLVFALAVLAVTVPWFVLIAHRQAEFAGYFLWKHHVLRFVSAFNHEAPILVLRAGVAHRDVPQFSVAGSHARLSGWAPGRAAQAQDARAWGVGARRGVDRGVLLGVQLQAADVHPACRSAVVFGAGLRAASTVGRQVRPCGLGPPRAPVARARHGPGGGHRSGHCRSGSGAGARSRCGQFVNFAVLGGSLAFLVYRLVHPCSWPARAASWGVVAGVSLLIMGFAFQKFVPEFARYRSVHANAARLCRTARRHAVAGRVFRVAERWQFTLPARRSGPPLRAMASSPASEQFILEHPHTVIVADPPHAALLRDTLGNRIALTRSRGARGRLYLLSTLPSADTLVGHPRLPLPVQRLGTCRRR